MCTLTMIRLCSVLWIVKCVAVGLCPGSSSVYSEDYMHVGNDTTYRVCWCPVNYQVCCLLGCALTAAVCRARNRGEECGSTVIDDHVHENCATRKTRETVQILTLCEPRSDFVEQLKRGIRL